MFRDTLQPKLAAAACGALVVLGLVTPSALASPASTVTRTEDAPGRFTLRVQAASGVANDLRVGGDAATAFTVRDGARGGPAALGGDCTDAGNVFFPFVSCPGSGVEVMVAKLGDGNDTSVNETGSQLYAFGEDGNDRLTGGSVAALSGRRALRLRRRASERGRAEATKEGGFCPYASGGAQGCSHFTPHSDANCEHPPTHP